MAELADALDSGSNDRKVVEVQVLLPAPNSTNPNFLMIGDGSVLLFCNIHSQNRFADKSNDERR